MSNRRSRNMFIGASLSALINIGTAGAAEAPQSSDSAPVAKPSHKAKASAKSSADLSKEMTAQLQALRDQVDVLQRRLDAQNAAERQTKATADQAAAQAASANAEAATATAAAQAIPAETKTAIDAATPKTDKIYYKGVTLTLGGFGALESVYRTKNETADIASTFSGNPLNSVSAGHTSEFRFSARQSRFTALAQGDVNPNTRLSFYGEFDFLGARRRRTRLKPIPILRECAFSITRSIGIIRDCTCWLVRTGRS